MNYNLSTSKNKTSTWDAAKKLWPLIVEEKTIMIWALIAVVINSLLSLFAPRLIAHTVDTYIV